MPQTELDRALRACRGLAAVVLTFGLALNLLMLVSPLYMMQVFDHVIGGHSFESLVILTAMALFAHAVMAALDVLRGQILTRAGGWLDERVGPAILASAMTIRTRTAGSSGGQGLRDLTTLRGFLAGPAITPLLDLPWAPIFLLALFMLHPLLGMIGLAGGAVLLSIGILNEVLTKKQLAKASAVARIGQQRTESALRNGDVIRALGMTGAVIDRWRRDTRDAVGTQEIAGDRSAVIAGISKFFRITIQTLITGAAAYLVLHQEVGSGVMLAASMLLGRALAPVENAIGSWRAVVSARLAFRRLRELLETNPVADRGLQMPRPTGRVSIERVSFVPPGAPGPSLLGVTLQLQPGEALGVIGPSASGKSTLARIAAGAWIPSAGHVRLDGAEISVWQRSGGARHIGYLPQDIELFAGTVAENIARLAKAEPQDIIAAADLVGLDETIRRLPKGYETEIGEDGLMLSGGQRQRLGLARAVYGNPSLIILDEPDASLDGDGEAALASAIDRLKSKGTTLIVVAHRPQLVELMDKVLVLKAGQVASFGPRAEVLRRPAPETTGPQRSPAPHLGLAPPATAQKSSAA